MSAEKNEEDLGEKGFKNQAINTSGSSWEEWDCGVEAADIQRLLEGGKLVKPVEISWKRTEKLIVNIILQVKD